MQRVRSDDEGALSILVERHWAPLVSYSAKIVGSRDGAEDIVQETFVRLWEGRKSWTPGGSLRSYLFRTARNLGLGRIRHLAAERRTEPQVRQSFEKTDRSPMDITATHELRSALQCAVDKLPSRRRQALVLVRFQGCSLAEAAEIMGLSRQTVANHISLALDDLRETLRAFTD